MQELKKILSILFLFNKRQDKINPNTIKLICCIFVAFYFLSHKKVKKIKNQLGGTLYAYLNKNSNFNLNYQFYDKKIFLVPSLFENNNLLLTESINLKIMRNTNTTIFLEYVLLKEPICLSKETIFFKIITDDNTFKFKIIDKKILHTNFEFFPGMCIIGYDRLKLLPKIDNNYNKILSI